MKLNHVFIISVVLFCLSSRGVRAQSFEKGDKIISAGIKLAVYKVNNQDENSEGDDAAASYTIPIGFEYALTNHIGVGIEAGFCNYFTGEDTITGTIASAGSFDMLLIGNYHWVRGGRVDLNSGIGIGFSSFKYNSNDVRDSKFKSTGAYARFNLINARFFVAKHFALCLNLGIPVMNFNNGRINDNLGSDYSYPLVFSGFDMGAGLAFRF